MSTFTDSHTDMTNLIQQHSLIYQQNKILRRRTIIQTIFLRWDVHFVDKLQQIAGNDITRFNQQYNRNLAFTLLHSGKTIDPHNLEHTRCPSQPKAIKAPFIWRKVVPGRRVTRLPESTLGEPTFHTFPYKTWRTVDMRNKKLARLEEWPA